MCDHCGCRAFPPIAELSAEHDEITRLAWETAEHPSPAATQTLLALLDRHVAKEEQALYPLLHDQAELAPERCAALEAEHTTIIEAITTGAFNRRAFYALAAHIEDEEMHLFPAAMFSFDDDHWDEATAVFMHVDAARELVGRIDSP